MSRRPRTTVRSATPTPSRPGTGGGRFGDLLIRIGGGDRAAFADVYDRIAAPVFQLARHRGLPAGMSEQLVEEVLLRVWRTAPGYAQQHRAAADWTLAVIDGALLELELGREANRLGANPPLGR